MDISKIKKLQKLVEICQLHDRKQKLKNYKAIYICTHKPCSKSYQISCLRCRNQFHKEHSVKFVSIEQYRSYWAALLLNTDRKVQKMDQLANQIKSKIIRLQDIKLYISNLQLQFKRSVEQINEEVNELKKQKKLTQQRFHSLDNSLTDISQLQQINEKLYQISQILQFNHKKNIVDYKVRGLQHIQQERKRKVQQLDGNIMKCYEKMVKVLQLLLNAQQEKHKQLQQQQIIDEIQYAIQLRQELDNKIKSIIKNYNIQNIPYNQQDYQQLLIQLQQVQLRQQSHLKLIKQYQSSINSYKSSIHQYQVSKLKPDCSAQVKLQLEHTQQLLQLYQNKYESVQSNNIKIKQQLIEIRQCNRNLRCLFLSNIKQLKQDFQQRIKTFNNYQNIIRHVCYKIKHPFNQTINQISILSKIHSQSNQQQHLTLLLSQFQSMHLQLKSKYSSILKSNQQLHSSNNQLQKKISHLQIAKSNLQQLLIIKSQQKQSLPTPIQQSQIQSNTKLNQIIQTLLFSKSQLQFYYQNYISIIHQKSNHNLQSKQNIIQQLKHQNQLIKKYHTNHFKHKQAHLKSKIHSISQQLNQLSSSHIISTTNNHIKFQDSLHSSSIISMDY